MYSPSWQVKIPVQEPGPERRPKTVTDPKPAPSSKTPSRSESDTESESSLFRTAVGAVKPIKHDRAQPTPSKRPKPMPKRRQDIAAQLEALDSPFEPALEAGDTLSFANPGVPTRQLRRLRRGQIRLDAQLDLHGMPSGDAHDALQTFLNHACADGLKCVRVIHGKGFGSPSGRSVIKSKVNHWLRTDPRVMAFCSSPQHEGGTGAVNVLLRS